ncbi:hypothetical protein AGMMS49579_12450 [Spirochaetia bacterium]|nr:hypothetical protein AGMMS49579_12450 [Spirochaetia bacterium]
MIEFIKNLLIVKPFKNLRKNRYIVNLDEESKSEIKKNLSFDSDEEIFIVLDDSPLKNLKDIVVFTNKKIYWNLKDVNLKSVVDRGEFVKKGPSSIDVKQLSGVSVFVNNENNSKFIYMISEFLQISLKLRYFDYDESLKIIFYDYITNYCGGYNPDKDKNEELYRKYLKEHKEERRNIVSLLFDTCNHLVITGLIISIFIRVPVLQIEKIIFFSLLLKFIGIVFKYKKSSDINALMILFVAVYLLVPGFFLGLDKTYVYFGYAGLATLLSVFDFDKIFKYIILILAIISLVLLFLHCFYLMPSFV